MEHQHSLPLHLSHFQKESAIVSRILSFFHSLALASLLYYRASFLFSINNTNIPLLPWVMLSTAELLLSFTWLLQQAFLWKPITRTAFPERLPKDEQQLPGFDVFVCTADPSKEPTVEVMNTVISAMALDYPAGKLHVYVSDDGGATVTLNGVKEAWLFAKSWLPFCRKFGITTRCPGAYFREEGDDVGGREFIQQKEKVKEKYEAFKERVLAAVRSASVGDATNKMTARDHPPFIQVMNYNCTDAAAAADDAEAADMPLLVYVAREKRPSQPHHFKAGALNVLLRVSAMISNSEYILVLDCDMYCNDPTSARQALCFHLDPNISPSLAFVQFPQKYHNVCQGDIYDSRLRSTFEVLWHGIDGVGGPILSGTGFYIKRQALCHSPLKEGLDLKEARECFGPSNELIRSLQRNYKPIAVNSKEQSLASLNEVQFLASCSYEHQTKWGEEVGFLYHSVLEDFLTGLILHYKGWRSVYCNPARPQFLGATPTNLTDLLVQNTRWSAGLTEVALSKYCPLIYGPSKMSILQRMCYVWMVIFPSCYFLSAWPFATIPQLCLLHGIPLYPKVSSPLFIVFVFIFMSSQLKHLYEVLTTGGSIKSWCNEQRIWMIKSLTCHVYGSLDGVMKCLGLRQTSFIPTNKVVDDQQEKHYQMGIYDFQTSNAYLVPLVTAVSLNFTSFVGGIARVIIEGNWDDMFAQLLLSGYILFMSCPVIEAMILRKDSGRVPLATTTMSIVFSSLILALGSFIVLS
ncbi:hypothetical protein Ancab_013185 [Ancistrocladus abbreviatus]